MPKKAKLKTINVRLTESYSTFVSRDEITLDVSNYPELDGMSEEEIKEYIANNAQDMESPFEWADNLYEALSQMDVIREKITDEETSIIQI